MANLGQGFNFNELPEDENSYELLPAGWYQAEVKGAELCTTKAGTGQYIKMKWSITGPTHSGRFVFSNINIRNPSAEAQKIGLGQLKSLMSAFRMQDLKDTDQLIGGSASIKLAIREGQNGYEAQNEIKAYKPLGNSRPPVQQPQPQTHSISPEAMNQHNPNFDPDEDIPF